MSIEEKRDEIIEEYHCQDVHGELCFDCAQCRECLKEDLLKLETIVIAEYTEFILMGFDKGMRISMAQMKGKEEKKKLELIYKQFMNSVLVSMERFEEIKK